MPHFLASGRNFSSVVDCVTVNPINESQFDYTATLTISSQAQPVNVSGSIQFNKKKKINYMTVSPYVLPPLAQP